MITRRNLVKSGLAAAGVVALSPRLTMSRVLAQALAPQIRLPGSSIPQFLEPLPLLSAAGGPMETVIAGTSRIDVTMREFRAAVLPATFTPRTGTYAGTWVWGYRTGALPTNPAGSYIGPVIVATRGTPTQVRWINDLPTGPSASDLLAYWNGTDQTLHWADPLNDGANACAHAATSGGPATGSCAKHYSGPAPAVPHLHGGEVPPVIDGGPNSWFTSDGGYHGPAYYTQGYTQSGGPGNEATYRYPNSQEAAPAWFHDHVLGLTRLGVYAGLAGAYPIIDTDLDLPTGLHPVGLQQGDSGAVDYLIPMVVQSRAFDTEGQLFFDNAGINPEHPFWIPELVGDVNVVNGKAWPFLDVQPRRYRFLFVNGSNARAYEMFFTDPVTKTNGPAMWQIGTDGGYLDRPVRIDPNAPKGQLQRLLLQPGERADIIVDFAGFAGQTLLIRNVGRHPFPNGTPPVGSVEGRVMQVRVGRGPVPDASYDPASGVPLRPPMVRLVDSTAGTLNVTADRTRQLTLNEVIGAGGPLELLVNNTKWDGTSTGAFADGVRPDFTGVTVDGTTGYYSELPEEGTTEVWEIVNLTADAHPIHTHLTQFQIISRQRFSVGRYDAVYAAAFPGGSYLPAYGPPLDYADGNPRALGGNPDITPYLLGPPRPPEQNEAGWKDVAIMYPGQVTRIAVRYAPTDTPAGEAGHYPFDPNAGDGHGYVWHCHIIDHEDNEMMRPLQVRPKDVDRDYVLGTDY